MPINPAAKIVLEIAKNTGLPLYKIKAAIDKLGHCDEKKIKGYIIACSQAVIRLKKDKNGKLVRMTNDDLAEQFK
jgi:hypothetical protein